MKYSYTLSYVLQDISLIIPSNTRLFCPTVALCNTDSPSKNVRTFLTRLPTLYFRKFDTQSFSISSCFSLFHYLFNRTYYTFLSISVFCLQNFNSSICDELFLVKIRIVENFTALIIFDMIKSIMSITSTCSMDNVSFCMFFFFFCYKIEINTSVNYLVNTFNVACLSNVIKFIIYDKIVDLANKVLIIE